MFFKQEKRLRLILKKTISDRKNAFFKEKDQDETSSFLFVFFL